MVAPTLQTGIESVIAPHLVPLTESHAQIAAVVDAVGAVRDAAHLQHCLYLAQEFRLLDGRRYWFAPEEGGTLPYSYVLDDHIRELLALGLLDNTTCRGADWEHAIRVGEGCSPVSRSTAEHRGRLSALADLDAGDAALLARSIFHLGRHGCHPVHARFCAEVATALNAALGGQDTPRGEATVERICATCRRLQSAVPGVRTPAYAF